MDRVYRGFGLNNRKEASHFPLQFPCPEPEEMHLGQHERQTFRPEQSRPEGTVRLGIDHEHQESCLQPGPEPDNAGALIVFLLWTPSWQQWSRAAIRRGRPAEHPRFILCCRCRRGRLRLSGRSSGQATMSPESIYQFGSLQSSRLC